MLNKESIPLLIAEIETELSKLITLEGKLKNKDLMRNEESLESAALRLHNFYTGCERIFKLIASDINDFVPNSWDWHRRLLTQMSLEVEGIRPAVITESVRRDMEELLSFRHLVRNIYGHELEPKRVERLVKLAKKLFPKLDKEIKAFVSYLKNLYTAL